MTYATTTKAMLERARKWVEQIPSYAMALLCVAVALSLVGILLALTGCAAQSRPHRAPPMSFRHCVVTNEAQGFIGCDCATPLVVWDAQLKRKVVYCDGKVQN